MSSEPTASPIVSSSISFTTLSLLGVAGSSANPLSSLDLLAKEKGLVGPAPTKTSGQAKQLTPEQVKFAEEPIHMLIGRSVKDMTDAELTAHCEMLRGLRKSPQTLQAKVKKDEELLDGMYGEGEDKKIRKAASKTVEEKTKRKGQNAEVQGAKLANKWANFTALPATTSDNQPTKQ